MAGAEEVGRALQAGDRVYVPPIDEPDDDPVGVILSIDEDGYARVRLDNGRETVIAKCSLGRVE